MRHDLCKFSLPIKSVCPFVCLSVLCPFIISPSYFIIYFIDLTIGGPWAPFKNYWELKEDYKPAAKSKREELAKQWVDLYIVYCEISKCYLFFIPCFSVINVVHRMLDVSIINPVNFWLAIFCRKRERCTGY